MFVWSLEGPASVWRFEGRVRKEDRKIRPLFDGTEAAPGQWRVAEAAKGLPIFCVRSARKASGSGLGVETLGWRVHEFPFRA